MEEPYPSQELTKTLCQLTRMTQAWALGQRVDPEHLRELRRQAILANHAYYLETIPNPGEWRCATRSRPVGSATCYHWDSANASCPVRLTTA